MNIDLSAITMSPKRVFVEWRQDYRYLPAGWEDRYSKSQCIARFHDTVGAARDYVQSVIVEEAGLDFYTGLVVSQHHNMISYGTEAGVVCTILVHPLDAGTSNDLADDESEVVTIVAEEAAEVVQACTKLQRFGDTRNPWNGDTNVAALSTEIGQLLAAIELAVTYAMVDGEIAERARRAKIAQWNTDPNLLRSAIAGRLGGVE